MQVIDDEVARAKRDQKSIGFLMFDVDYFKRYNDVYGHIKGDEVLVKIADVMQHIFKRASDFSFRLGGEEFGILFSDLTHDQVLTIAELLRREVEALHVEHSQSDVSHYVTISVGVKMIDVNNFSLQECMQAADEAMYKAKQSGRNKVHQFDYTI